MPRSGTITAVYASFFGILSPDSSSGLYTISARLYVANPLPGDTTITFNAVGLVSLSPSIGPSTSFVNIVATGSATGLSIPVTAGSQYILVFYAFGVVVTGNAPVGFVNGSVVIS